MLDMAWFMFLPLQAQVHEMVDGLSYALHTFLDPFLFRIGKAQAKLLLPTSIYMKWLTNNEGYPSTGRFP
jgi:hypothetical protein